MTFSIVLGLISAVFFALAGALQHSVTRPMSQTLAKAGWLPIIGVLWRLVRHPVWLCGVLANVLGFLAHAAALRTGSITIVQALLSVQLMFALPLASLRSGRLPVKRDWIGTAAICAGLATLVTFRGDVPQTVARQGLTPVVALLALTLMGVLVGLARRWDSVRTAFVGCAAGTGFSLTAVFIVLMTHQLPEIGWPMLALPLSGLIAAVIAQDAYGSGSLPTAMTAMIVSDALMSWLWGAVLFDSLPPTSLASLSGLAASGLLISLGVGLLAYSPTLFDRRVALRSQA
jgi:drug/metabolite transporter (DMT)-like permease